MAGQAQVFVASTLYGVVSLSAAIDNDCFGDAAVRHLVISNNATIPEIVPSAAEMSGFDLLAKRFDRVHDYNEALAPFHPVTWAPRQIDGPLWQRYLRAEWGLGEDDVHLIVESIQVDPAQALCRIFHDARIDVYADGLMSYGPTRSDLTPLIGTRIERLLYPDLVPQISPLLLAEWDVPTEIIPAETITRTLAEISGETVLATADAAGTPRTGAGSGRRQDGIAESPVAVLLGQYLSPLGILSAAEEEELHRQMLGGAIAAGHRRVVFKPHPSAPRTLADSLQQTADACGVRLWVLTEAALAETLYHRLQVAAVFGCFSTAMVTASRFYQIPVTRIGTELVLERLTPYHNSNRIPLTIIDALVPPIGGTNARRTATATMITELITSVGYVMQPNRLIDRRPAVEAFLAANVEQHQRYFNRRRLTKLELPGALPPKAPSAGGSAPFGPLRRRLRRAARVSGRLVRRRTAALRPRRPQ